MPLAVLDTVANVVGLITPASDLGVIIKSIADSIQEVKANEESSSYWDKTLKDHAKEVYAFMVQCKEAGANETQVHSLLKLLESLVVLRKEIIENSRRSYMAKWWTSGDIRRKIERVERRKKHCQDLFVADTLSTHTGMLLRVDRSVREIANSEGRNRILEQTVIKWKVPGKADLSDPMAFEYAYLVKKSRTLIFELKSNSGYIQERLLKSDHDFEISNFVNVYYPKGNLLSEYDDAAFRVIRACRMLRARNLKNTSFIVWLIGNEGLSASLYNLGLKNEARQIEEIMCHIWSFLAFRRGSASIYYGVHFGSALLHDISATIDGR